MSEYGDHVDAWVDGLRGAPEISRVASALGDSSVYSTGITETVKPDRLGSALAVRSLLGFGAGISYAAQVIKVP